MTEHDIAYKYVHGLHDALTDSQEKTDMANDIINFAKEYHNKQLSIHGVVVSLPTEEQLISELHKTLDKLKDHEMKLFRHKNYQRGYDAGFISAYEFIKDR